MRESHIVSAIKSWLQIYENQGKLVFIRNNSGATVTHEQGRKPRFWKAGKPGSSDFLIFICGGRTLHVECKNDTDGGRQSFAQQEYQRKIEDLGHPYYIVRSLDDMEKILRDKGVI